MSACDIMHSACDFVNKYNNKVFIYMWFLRFVVFDAIRNKNQQCI